LETVSNSEEHVTLETVSNSEEHVTLGTVSNSEEHVTLVRVENMDTEAHMDNVELKDQSSRRARRRGRPREVEPGDDEDYLRGHGSVERQRERNVENCLKALSVNIQEKNKLKTRHIAIIDPERDPRRRRRKQK
jgi:hypothetical protein